MPRPHLVAAVLLALGATAVVHDTSTAVTPAAVPAPRTAAAVSFAEQIQPIFNERCVTCHGGQYEGEQRVEAGLDLRTWESLLKGSEFGTVLEPGNPDESILVDMIAMGDMPEEGDPLTPEQIELIRTWIAEGAENN